MGHDAVRICAKVLVEDASIPFLGLAHLLNPHVDATTRGAFIVMRAALGGLWVEGHAAVQDGIFYFSGGKIISRRINQDVDCCLALKCTSGCDVVQTLSGGLMPTSRLITIWKDDGRLKLATPLGHGDILGAAIQSWQHAETRS